MAVKPSSATHGGMTDRQVENAISRLLNDEGNSHDQLRVIADLALEGLVARTSRSEIAMPDMNESGWTPEQALRFYATGKHFDVVEGRTRILDTGAVASDALKGLSAEYATGKGTSVSATAAHPLVDGDIATQRALADAWKPGDQRVVCAAIRDKLGRIVTGARHFDAVMIEQIRRTVPDQDAFRTAEQGFIDQFGNFLTREAAMTVATKWGQIIRDDEGRQSLYSENLY